MRTISSIFVRASGGMALLLAAACAVDETAVEAESALEQDAPRAFTGPIGRPTVEVRDYTIDFNMDGVPWSEDKLYTYQFFRLEPGTGIRNCLGILVMKLLFEAVASRPTLMGQKIAFSLPQYEVDSVTGAMVDAVHRRGEIYDLGTVELPPEHVVDVELFDRNWRGEYTRMAEEHMNKLEFIGETWCIVQAQPQSAGASSESEGSLP